MATLSAMVLAHEKTKWSVALRKLACTNARIGNPVLARVQLDYIRIFSVALKAIFTAAVRAALARFEAFKLHSKASALSFDYAAHQLILQMSCISLL